MKNKTRVINHKTRCIMRKFIVSMLLLVCATGAFAQFEKNKWFVNPSLTGLDWSYNKDRKMHFGFEAKGGAFVVDNFALLLHIGGDYGKHQDDVTTLGVGGRYYLDNIGLYFGLGLGYNYYDARIGKSYGDFGADFELGYAFFLNRSITIEPGFYYNQSFNHHRDHSRFGLKVGFGVYF